MEDGAFVLEADAQYRVCPKCGETKPGGHFNRHKRQCKECRAANQRSYVSNNQAVVQQRNREWQQRTGYTRRRHLQEYFGITPEQYDEMLESQGGVCAICRKEPVARDGRSAPLDHDHVTGQIRGILCTNCNVGIAQFDDNPDLLGAAIAYLARFQHH